MTGNPFDRRTFLKTSGITLAGTTVWTEEISANSGDFADDSSELWSIPLEYTSGTNIKIADTDDDGVDEVAIASTDSFGPSNYGIVKQGDWLWEENSSASVQADTSGDVNGDGEPEIIFKAKVSPVWVRPYTHEGDLLWSGDLGGWVDDTAPIDLRCLDSDCPRQRY